MCVFCILLSQGYIVLIWSTLSLALALTIEYTIRLLKTTLKDPVRSDAAVFCSYNNIVEPGR